MTFKITMCDWTTDERIVEIIKAGNVFDAISIAAQRVPHPDETELIEAVPEEYYYWLDTDYYFGDFSVPKFALVRGQIVDGKKDRDTEEVILWASWEDVDGADCNLDWETLDNYIKENLGFLPEYEVN